MIEIEALYSSRTLNSAYIFFDDVKKFNKMRDKLIPLFVRHSFILVKCNGQIYYGIKMFRMKRQFLEICKVMKEVLAK